ncbi:MAG: aspartate aminotransferase family protein [Ignavibacteriae bacterium HGW-Ignavibacteriae-1]|jgi:aromatic-L-amino-acid decarboxylase|nr:MAG: aspartate aminotransferase family protein [Ignavibacteriae bacterium HGW-Ignavibacteriae-1]
MKKNEFIKHGYQIIDKIAEYLSEADKYPVRSQVKPGEVRSQIPASPPNEGEDFDDILKDFDNIIMPGLTHWQSPNFYAYFPANTSYPSILGELMTSGLGVNAFSWETSPAATELEETVMDWLRQMLGLSNDFVGVIQDTASTATICSILTAREKMSNFESGKKGIGGKIFRVYASTEIHSSIEKAVRIAGIGTDNLVKIPTDENYAMRSDLLRDAIQSDLKAGFTPMCVVSAMGTTGSLAFDPIAENYEICKEFGLWHHIDAAYAGSAFILEEFKHLSELASLCDTFVFNPHKWLFINFDFSAYFVKDEESLIRTFEILPEYLRYKRGSEVKNYRDWGIQLGRRFRALKAWFVIRSFGVDELKSILRHHIALGAMFHDWVKSNKDFEVLAPVVMNVVCFRFHPVGIDDETLLNSINVQLLDEVNSTGKVFLSKTKLNDIFTIRMVTANLNVTEQHISDAWKLIVETSENLIRKTNLR